MRHGCNLSLLLFNIYAEKIMRFGQLGRRNRHRRKSGNGNLRYVDDTTVIAGTKEDLIQIMERIRKHARKRAYI